MYFESVNADFDQNSSSFFKIVSFKKATHACNLCDYGRFKNDQPLHLTVLLLFVVSSFNCYTLSGQV